MNLTELGRKNISFISHAWLFIKSKCLLLKTSLKIDKIKIRYFLTVLLNCNTKGEILETPNLKEWAYHNHNCKK